MKVIRSMGVFYTNDGLIGLQDLDWIQGSINVLIGIFRRVGLMANVAKSNMMTSHPGEFREHISEEAFSWRRTG